MSLLTTAKLGHYAKKATKAIIKPVNAFIAIAAISSIVSTSDIQAQTNGLKNTNDEITINGYGKLSIQDEESSSIESATITWTPVDVPGDSIPPPYTFISDFEGISEYEVLVLHTIIEDINENNLNLEVTQARPNPSTDFTFNYITNSAPKNPVVISDISGRKILETKLESYVNNVAVYHADLSGLANGAYIATTIIGNKAYSNKLIKIGDKQAGNLGSSARDISPKNTNKEMALEEAIYDVMIEAEGFHTINDQRTVIEGDNGWGVYTMISTILPIPQHQDLVGVAMDEANNFLPMSNVTAILYNQTTNETITKTTGSDGTYTFENVPTGSSCFISVGGVSGYYSFNDQDYMTPSSIDDMSDTIASFFSAPMYTARPDIFQWDVLTGQTSSGMLETERLYWFAPEVASTAQALYNAWIPQFDAQTNDYTHTQTLIEDEADIKIFNGANNTSSNSTTVSTPLGDYHPTNKSFMYINTAAGYGVFTHELGQADGKSQVSGTGYLSSNPPPTGPDAQDIAVGQLDKMHWVDNVFTDEITYFDLNKISETLDNKSPQFKASQIR